LSMNFFSIMLAAYLQISATPIQAHRAASGGSARLAPLAFATPPKAARSQPRPPKCLPFPVGELFTICCRSPIRIKIWRGYPKNMKCTPGGGGGMWQAKRIGHNCSESRGRDTARAADIPPPIPGRRLRGIPSARSAKCQRTGARAPHIFHITTFWWECNIYFF
jgi:hypothetical protein